MNIKASLVVSLGLMLSLGMYGCSNADSEVAESVKTITVQDIKDHSEDYDVYYLHTLLRYVAEQHEEITGTQLADNLDIADAYYRKIGASVDDELKEDMVKAQIYEELAILRIMGKTYKQVEQEAKNGTDIFKIYQYVFLGGAGVADKGQELSKALQGVVSDSEIQAIYTKFKEDAEIDASALTFTKETLPSVFSKVTTLNEGDTYTIGDKQYVGVVQLQDKQQATVEGLIRAYKQYVTTNYPDTMDMITKYLKSLPTQYRLGDGVEELIYQQIDGLE